MGYWGYSFRTPLRWQIFRHPETMKRKRTYIPPDTDNTHIRPTPGPRPVAAYSGPVDAVVLAGTHETKRHLIGGRNKAFLVLDGRPMVERVVEALLAAQSIDRVFVVGPVAELNETLGGLLSPRVRVVPQAGKIIANAWAGFHASQRVRGSGPQENPDRPLLYVTADLPLIRPAAVDDFVARCAEVDRRSENSPGALLAGVAEEESLRMYYPREDRPGMVRPYVHARSGLFRLANIYIARPLRMPHLEPLEAGFSFRKAKDWKNVLALGWAFFHQRGGWRAARGVLGLWLALVASRRPGRLYRALRRRNTEQGVEAIGTLLLGGPVKVVVTPYGGLSIDIDDEDDLRILESRLAEWSRAPHEEARPA